MELQASAQDPAPDQLEGRAGVGLASQRPSLPEAFCVTPAGMPIDPVHSDIFDGLFAREGVANQREGFRLPEAWNLALVKPRGEQVDSGRKKPHPLLRTLPAPRAEAVGVGIPRPLFQALRGSQNVQVIINLAVVFPGASGIKIETPDCHNDNREAVAGDVVCGNDCVNFRLGQRFHDI